MGLLHSTRPRALRRWDCRSSNMQDILWVGLFLVLLIASLGYAALCDRA
jgi:hypothetical protein